jgi:hypothetical protein
MVNYIMTSSAKDGKGPKMSEVDYKKINGTNYIFQNPGHQNNSTALGGLIGRSGEHHGYASKSKASATAYSHKSSSSF